MQKEESLNKFLYKIELISIKTIPMIISFLYLMNTISSYFDIDMYYLSYIEMGLLMMFLYISSYVFKFCSWHRLFLHYITINLILNIVDYYWCIPISDRNLFIMYMIITGVFMFLFLILKSRYESCSSKVCS